MRLDLDLFAIIASSKAVHYNQRIFQALRPFASSYHNTPGFQTQNNTLPLRRDPVLFSAVKTPRYGLFLSSSVAKSHPSPLSAIGGSDQQSVYGLLK